MVFAARFQIEEGLIGILIFLELVIIDNLIIIELGGDLLAELVVILGILEK
jgi:hypothetical protein